MTTIITGHNTEPEPREEAASEAAIVTPAFVVDERALRRQAASFTSAMAKAWPGGIVAYSVKTNSLPWIVAWMREQGVWAEVVSDDEYDLATALGHDPNRMVFNGPVKSREALLNAIEAGSIINLDSRREIQSRVAGWRVRGGPIPPPMPRWGCGSTESRCRMHPEPRP